MASKWKQIEMLICIWHRDLGVIIHSQVSHLPVVLQAFKDSTINTYRQDKAISALSHCSILIFLIMQKKVATVNAS